MTKGNISLEKGYQIIILFASILIIGCMGAYCFSPATDSDMVEGLFWADAAMSVKALLCPDFVYSYAIPFGSNLILIPFIRLFGMTQMANSLGMFFFYLLIITVCYVFLRALDINKYSAVIGTAIVILAFRTQMGVNLLHHVLFYQLGFICFTGIFFSLLNIIKNRETSVHKQSYVFLLFFTLLSGSNGVPSIMLSAIPVLFALLVVMLQGRIYVKTFTKICGLILIGVVAGYGIYLIALKDIQESSYLENTGSYVFNSTKIWIKNLEEFPKIWLDLFMVTNPDQESIFCFAGFETVISILISILIFMIPFLFLVRMRKLETSDLLLFWGCVAIWAVCLFQYVFVRRKAEDRLLYNVFFANFTLLAVIVCRYRPQAIKQRIIVLIIAVTLSIYGLMFSVNANWSYNSLNFEKLEELGLTYGFAASFWDANINTINSGDSIKVRPVTISNGSITPWNYQTNNLWYELPSDGEFWFLLLHDDDYKKLLSSPNKLLLDNCVKVLSLTGNYANPLDSTRHAYNDFKQDQDYKALMFPMNKWEECIFGKRVSYNFESNGWSSACESLDGVRHIHEGGVSFGPYLQVKKGENCRVFLDGKNLNHAQIQVYSLQNDETIYIDPEFKLREDDQIEFVIRAPLDLEAMEVIVKNPSNDNDLEDILLYSETVELITNELL